MRISLLLNRYISALVDGDPGFALEDAHLVAAMNFGTQINGSWRNGIGAEGSRRAKELIIRFFLDRALVSQTVTRQGISLPPSLPSSVENVQRLVATNGYQVVFGSEPDISIVNPTGVREVAIEEGGARPRWCS